MTTLPNDVPAVWIEDLVFERSGPLRQALKAAIINPFGNYFPAPVLKLALWMLGSELAAASWKDPGGWRSMVISYASHRKRLADKILCTLGTVPKALRNRRLLAGRVLSRLIDRAEGLGQGEPVHVLCLGAGPGVIINDAMRAATRASHATLVDLSSEAFEYGRRLAAESGMADRVRFIQGDVRNVAGMLQQPPNIVKMLGICEYLSDEQVTDIVRTVARVMPAGSRIVFNSISDAHGTDRFFRRVFGLKMIHRSPADLANLMRRAGFDDFTALAEPLGVFHIVVGRKVAE